MSHASIYTNNLTIGYRNRVVQAGLNFALYSGEIVSMLGPNGCGKSTLLQTLSGLISPLGGSFASDESALVLTESTSLENTTVHDVVALGRFPYTDYMGTLDEDDERIISESLASVGFIDVANWKDCFFNALSDGEKQRVLIAKALAQTTPVILLDEPTAHLDLPNRILVLKLLRRLAHEEGKTILISTHELELALQMSDRILLMTPFKGIELDKAEKLVSNGSFTKAFGMEVFGTQQQ